jgi:hypothetical protein
MKCIIGDDGYKYMIGALLVFSSASYDPLTRMTPRSSTRSPMLQHGQWNCAEVAIACRKRKGSLTVETHGRHEPPHWRPSARLRNLLPSFRICILPSLPSYLAFFPPSFPSCASTSKNDQTSSYVQHNIPGAHLTGHTAILGQVVDDSITWRPAKRSRTRPEQRSRVRRTRTVS